MNSTNESYTYFYWLIGIVGLFILMCVLVLAVQFFKDFLEELRYINMEIERTDGSEQKYWKRQRRRLWLSLIPFVKY